MRARGAERAKEKERGREGESGRAGERERDVTRARGRERGERTERRGECFLNHLVARIDDVTRAARSLPLSLALSFALDTRRRAGVRICRSRARTDVTSPSTDRMLDPRLLGVADLLFSPADPHLSSSRRRVSPLTRTAADTTRGALMRPPDGRRQHAREKLPRRRRSAEIDDGRERERRRTRAATLVHFRLAESPFRRVDIFFFFFRRRDPLIRSSGRLRRDQV